MLVKNKIKKKTIFYKFTYGLDVVVVGVVVAKIEIFKNFISAK